MSFEIKRARSKTAVFSGTKQHCDYSVPRLDELCIKTLQKHANKIECVGDVPYYMLKPLMKELSLPNLRRIEAYNPHFIDEPGSAINWKKHCERHFSGRLPEEGENWRDLFKRCERERDHRIEKIAKRIKRHEEKAPPQRQVRVVDNQLSNGRKGAISTVIKKTIKTQIPDRGGLSNGSSIPSSSSSPSSSSNSRPGYTTKTTTVVIRREAGNGSSGSRLIKPKTAPLMQKSMQLFKSRFRR